MKNAYECKEEYGRDGRCIRRERAIGPIVPWSVVVLVALLMGKAFDLPSVFWHMFNP